MYKYVDLIIYLLIYVLKVFFLSAFIIVFKSLIFRLNMYIYHIIINKNKNNHFYFMKSETSTCIL